MQSQMVSSRKFDSPPRVLIVSPQPFYEDRGTPIAVLQVAAALTALDCEVDVLAYPIGKSVSLPNMRLQRSRNLFGIRNVRIGFSFKKVLLDLGMLGRLPSLLQPDRFDVVHVLEEMALPVIFLCRRRNLPVIYDMQSSLPDQLRTNAICRLRPVQYLLRKVEDWMLSRATAVICSAGLLQHVKARAPHALAHEWKFAGQPRDETQRPAALRARLGIPADARIILYCGTFEPYQGIDMLLAAIPAVAERDSERRRFAGRRNAGRRPMKDPSVSELVLPGQIANPSAPAAAHDSFLSRNGRCARLAAGIRRQHSAENIRLSAFRKAHRGHGHSRSQERLERPDCEARRLFSGGHRRGNHRPPASR